MRNRKNCLAVLLMTTIVVMGCGNQQVEKENSSAVSERASNVPDESEDCEKEFLDSFYELQDKMSFHIEELRPDFIDFIYNYKMPNKQNADIAALIEARKHKDEEKVNTIKEKINCAFEEDLILSIQDYYDKIYD